MRQKSNRPFQKLANTCLCPLVACLGIFLASSDLSAQEAAGQTAEDESSGWLFSSPLVDVSWPKLNWKTTPEDGAAEKPGLFEGPMNKISSATRQAIGKTKARWNKTVDRLKLTSHQQPANRDGNTKPGFWQRMFTAPEDDGPLTTTEFLSQRRPE